MSKIFLTFSDVARKAQITRATLYKWQASGRFNIAPMDNQKPSRWHVADVEGWIAGLHLEPSSSTQTVGD